VKLVTAWDALTPGEKVRSAMWEAAARWGIMWWELDNGRTLRLLYRTETGRLPLPLAHMRTGSATVTSEVSKGGPEYQRLVDFVTEVEQRAGVEVALVV